MSQHDPNPNRPQYDPNLHAQRLRQSPEGFHAPSQPTPPPPGSYPYPPVQYPYPPVEPPRKRWARRHPITTGLGIVGAILIIAVIAISSSSTPTVTSAPAAATQGATTPASAPSSASDSTAGPVGATFTITDDSGNKYEVTLSKVIDPATPLDEFNQPDNGKRLVSAIFTIKGDSGHPSDDANSLATLIGSDSQTYEFSIDDIKSYTNFDNGEFNVKPGVSLVGAVTFEVPAGVKTASIVWTPDLFGGDTATWKVGS